jgi:hypothetical protein
MLALKVLTALFLAAFPVQCQIKGLKVCESSRLVMKCDGKGYAIRMLGVFYERSSFFTCQDFPMRTSLCSYDATQTFQNRFDGEVSVNVSVISNDLVGFIPCSGTTKQLNISYSCVANYSSGKKKIVLVLIVKRNKINKIHFFFKFK